MKAHLIYLLFTINTVYRICYIFTSSSLNSNILFSIRLPSLVRLHDRPQYLIVLEKTSHTRPLSRRYINYEWNKSNSFWPFYCIFRVLWRRFSTTERYQFQTYINYNKPINSKKMFLKCFGQFNKIGTECE